MSVRVTAIAIVALSLLAACGQSGSAGEAPATVSGVLETTTTVRPESSSTVAVPDTPVVPPSTASRELDRSILSLGLAPMDGSSGRFRLEPGPNTEILMIVEGRYWVGDGGTVYTALDVDTELIAGHMAVLADTVEAMGGQPVDSPYLTSLREHYRGDEFQIGLTDLIRSLAVGALPAEWAEQWGWFIQADGGTVPEELVACRDAITSFDEAARIWVGELAIDFVDGTWVFPVADLKEALAAEIVDASICELFVEMPGNDPEILFSRSVEFDRQRIEVLVDDNIYTDRDPEPMFAIVMWPDESVGSIPSSPNPAALMTLRGSYLVAIGVCGELPWIYSNFAAGDTYYAPDGDGYPGPVVFTSGWYCEDSVPEGRRHP